MNIMDYLTVTEEYPDKLYAIFNKDKNKVQRLTNKKCFMNLSDNEEIRRVSHFVQIIIDLNALKKDGYASQTVFNFDLAAELKKAFYKAQFYGLSRNDTELVENGNTRRELNLWQTQRFGTYFTAYFGITDDDVKEVISVPKRIATKKAAIQQKKEATENIRKTFNTFVRPSLKAVVDEMASKPENIAMKEGLKYLSHVLERDIWHFCLTDDVLQKICDDAIYKFLTDNFGSCGLKFDRSKIHMKVPYDYTIDLDDDSSISFDLGQD